MKSSWPQLVFAAVMACATLGTSLYVADQTSEALVGKGLFENSSGPSPADVLDGRVADAERRAAIAAMAQLSHGLNVEGVTPVAEVTWTSCSSVPGRSRHGRIARECEVDVASYQAWSGEYHDRAKLIGRAITSECPLALSQNDYSEPRVSRPTSVMKFGCDADISVRANFVSTQGLTSADSHFSLAELLGSTDALLESSRWVSGPSPTDTAEALSGYDWFAVVVSRQTYYENAP